ncbi:MAG: phage portal protein, partial [Actinomycetota bacterium]
QTRTKVCGPTGLGSTFKPIVFTAAAIRLSVFSQARLIKRRRRNGRVVEQFTDQTLAKFQRPWPGGTTSDLLARMLLHVDVAGNAFVRDSPGRLHMMRPDRVTIVLGSQLDEANPAAAEDVEVVGYVYDADGQSRFYGADEVAHFAPMPDPQSNYRGMSWMTPIVRDVRADSAATTHKSKFFTNAATPNLLVSFDMELEFEKVKAFKELMENDHVGAANAYKTLYLGGGADATVIGKDMQEIDFAKTVGKGETRILMAAGVHPTIAGASEGLSGSSLNAGNYNAAKRAFSDIHLQHLWTNAVASLSTLVDGDAGVELWFDKSEIPFLQDDLKDTAEIQAQRAAAIRSLTEAGYQPQSVVDAIENDDLTQLAHTGVFS